MPIRSHTYSVIQLFGQTLAWASKSTPGARGPSSPNGPICGSESAEIRSPALQKQVPEALRFARRLRRLDLHCGGAPNFCRSRAAERA
eukprot:8375538-Alexandrium_andersonii.AAC.1